MAVHELNLQSLLELDGGRVYEAFQQALRRVAMDCDDRPGDTSARKVNLQAEVKPICDEGGGLDSLEVAFQVKDAVPTRKSKIYNMGFRRGGQVVFNDLSDDDVHQRTIDDEE